jgi:RNA polymerase sigma-70 factor (ECF subfamily)
MDGTIGWDGWLRAWWPRLAARADGHSDDALVERARHDPEAFAQLYRLHYSSVALYLWRRTADVHAAEDLLSEVFLAALSSLPRYANQGIPFRHWLYRIATNAANRWARARRRACLDLEAASDVVCPERATPDEEPRLAMTALAALSPKLQSVAILHYLEDLSVEEIARILDCRSGTVKSRLSRARDALRKTLERQR